MAKATAPVPAVPPAAPAAPGTFANPLPALDAASFELESAPLPDKSTSAKAFSSKYPWASMKLTTAEDGKVYGDRFFVAGKVPKDMSGTITSARKATGNTFVAYLGERKVGEETVKGVWVQRVEHRDVVKRTPRVKVGDGTATSQAVPANPGVLPPPPPVDVPAPLPPLPPVPPAS